MLPTSIGILVRGSNPSIDKLYHITGTLRYIIWYYDGASLFTGKFRTKNFLSGGLTQPNSYF